MEKNYKVMQVKLKSFKRYWPELLTFFSLAMLYFLCLPHTVQDLDSGEMVAKSFQLEVAHPPGYPLFIWVYYLFTHLVAIDALFWRAALFTMFFSLATLFLLYRALQHQHPHWSNLLWTFPLALSQLYWRYSLIPDVFMLHLFLCTLFFYVFMFTSSSSRQQLWMALIAAFGMANHHSFIFLLPLFIIKRPRWRYLIISGLVLFLLYLSVLLMHPSSLYSWGLVDNLPALWRHLIRADYGTFQLSGRAQHLYFGEIFSLFGKNILSQFPLVLLLVLWPIVHFIQKRKIDTPYFLLLGLLILYIAVFFSKANIRPQGLGEDIVQRFYLLPLLFLYFLLVIARRTFQGKVLGRIWIMGGLAGMVISLVNALNYYQDNNFSKNTIIEDYAYNLLQQIPRNRPAILFVDSDTKFFAIHYQQN
ncbi:MAG: DUF2723 domain-containing protein, partial [Pseudomonadota bacterium]